MMRCFLALDLPPIIKHVLAHEQEALRNTRLADGSWTKPEHFHLTLRFFGEQAEEAIKDIEQRLDHATLPTTNVALTQLGAFTNKNPRVIWAGITGAEELYKEVDEALGTRYAADKPFKPHITLLRVREQEHKEALLAHLNNKTLTTEPFPARTMTLYHSILSRTRANHKPLQTWKLYQ